MARSPDRERPSTLDLDPNAGQPAAPRSGGRHREDAREPQVQRPRRAAVVRQGARCAGTRGAVVGRVGPITRQYRRPGSKGSPLWFDAVLLGTRDRAGGGRWHYPRGLSALPRRDDGVGFEQHRPTFDSSDLECLRGCHRGLGVAAAHRAPGQGPGGPGVGGLPGGPAPGRRCLSRRSKEGSPRFERQAHPALPVGDMGPVAPSSGRWCAWRYGSACRSRA
jgi:hypothetical protein